MARTELARSALTRTLNCQRGISSRYVYVIHALHAHQLFLIVIFTNKNNKRYLERFVFFFLTKSRRKRSHKKVYGVDLRYFLFNILRRSNFMASPYFVWSEIHTTNIFDVLLAAIRCAISVFFPTTKRRIFRSTLRFFQLFWVSQLK